MEKIAIFPGSFDPFTKGHESLLRRGLTLFDGSAFFGIQITKFFHGLRAALLSQLAFRRFILRGIRSIKDYEYEMNIADLNRRLTGVETIILFTEPEWAFISSTMVKELMHFGKDISPYIPEGLEYE